MTKHLLIAGLIFGTGLAQASISFDCAGNIDAAVAGTCGSLNTTIAGYYSSSFTNANASIYILYGATGLGSSTQFQNYVSYDDYRNALIGQTDSGLVRTGAIASLPALEPALYNGANVEVSSALGQNLGFSGMLGITASQSSCALGVEGCYNAIITITDDPGTLLYYRNGPQDPSSYDFYTTVQHEVNEVLGASSCISTSGGALSNGCDGTSPSAVDLFRYNAGNRVLIDAAPGAYFSYDGGATNGASGALYNTLADDNDYGDFATTCPGPSFVQNASQCPGIGGVDILNEDRSSLNILNAVGYNLNQTSAVPEPGTITMFAGGLLALGAFQRRRKTPPSR